MKKILTIGSALVDIFMSSEQFQLDPTGTLTCGAANGKLDVDSLIVKTGGGASNTAVGFARLGYQAQLIAELGKDEFAQLIVSELEKEGVSAEFLVKEHKEQTGGSVILVTKDGERMVLVHRGAASQLNPYDIPRAAFEGLDWVYLSSISGQVDTIKQLAQFLQEFNVQCTWNPGNKELAALVAGELTPALLPVGIFMVNRQEWEQITVLHDQCLKQFPVVVVTEGVAGGTVYQHGQEPYSYQATQVTAVDVTGAGDAFGTALTVALLQGQPMVTAVEWGKRNAASVVQQVGAKPGLLSSL